AGLAWEAGAQPDSAAVAYGAARAAGLATIDAWLRVRQARVTRDTGVAFRLLADVAPPAGREVPAARAHALLAAGDSLAALEAFAQAGRALDVGRLAVARGDSGRARDALYGLMARAPETDDAAAAVGVVLASLPPRTAPERVALARAMKPHGAAADARLEVERAVRQGDSGAPTALYVLGDMFADRGDWAGAAQWFGELVARYPADVRASLALPARGGDAASWPARQHGGAVPSRGGHRRAAADCGAVLAR